MRDPPTQVFGIKNSDFKSPLNYGEKGLLCLILVSHHQKERDEPLLEKKK